MFCNCIIVNVKQNLMMIFGDKKKYRIFNMFTIDSVSATIFQFSLKLVKLTVKCNCAMTPSVWQYHFENYKVIVIAQ